LSRHRDRLELQVQGCAQFLGKAPSSIDVELMGAWRSARNVLGPFKTKNEPEAGGSQTPKAA